MPPRSPVHTTRPRVSAAAAVLLATTALATANDCSTWIQDDVPTPNGQGLLYGTDVGPDGTAWAVGTSRVPVGVFSTDDTPYALRWNGSAWENVPVPNPSPFAPGQREASFADVAVIAADDVWAVGTYRAFGSDGFPGYQTLAMHFDGASWTHVPTPLTPPGGTGADFNAIDALGPDDIWVAGMRVAPEIPSITGMALLMHYDGETWTEIPNPPGTLSLQVIEDIRAFDDGTVWCVGHYGEALGDNPWLAKWDGTSWTFYEGLPIPPGLAALDTIDGHAPDDIWVAGRVNTPLGTFALVLHWDGASWTWDAPDVSSMQSVSILGIGVTPDGTVHVAGTWTNEPSPALPLPFLSRRAPDGMWSATESVTNGPESAWYRDVVAIDDCTVIGVGQRQPLLGNIVRLVPDAVVGDVDGDGAVGLSDILSVLSAWGTCAGCPADLDGDDVVGLGDLLVVLSAWS